MEFQAYTINKYPEWACIRVKAPESENRVPIHLCCVIDTSGSMHSENKLENVKRSLQFLLDYLGPQDMISIITFSDTATTVLKQINTNTYQKDNIRTRISLIRAESNTNLSAAIIQIQDVLLSRTDAEATNMKQGILLLTDGIANKGVTKIDKIMELSRTILDGVSISSIGYGLDHNAELLQNISNERGGSYYVVNNLEDVAVVFGDILGGLVSCHSQQVKVIVPGGTELKTRYHYSDSVSTGGSGLINNSDIEIMIGDIASGMEAAFLAKLNTGKTITLKGYNLEDNSSFNLTTTITTSDDSGIQTTGQAHYMRFEVLRLLDESKQLMVRHSSVSDIRMMIDKINESIDIIVDYNNHMENSLWDILIDELKTCKNNLESNMNSRNNIHARHNICSPHIMTQRAGYLGRMRGIPATQVPIDEVPSAIPLARGFSNIAQRQISSQLASAMTPCYQIDNNDDPQNITRNITYATNLPPPLPPLPPWETTRQIACPSSDSSSN